MWGLILGILAIILTAVIVRIRESRARRLRAESEMRSRQAEQTIRDVSREWRHERSKRGAGC